MEARLRTALLRSTVEVERRRGEALRLYVPQPHQEPIFRTDARFRLIRGGNRSGKTLNGAVRVADMVTGFERFLPVAKDPSRLKVLCVSLDFSLLSDNIYRKLFEPGAFDICGECYRPRWLCDPAKGGEGICKGEWRERKRPADPLIPPRMVKNFSWREKGRLIPDKCWLKNGAQIDFRSTDQGRAKFQGTSWDYFWADEEATNDEEIMNEIMRGLIDRGGGGMITATPLAASLTMVNWSERAAEETEERHHRMRKGLAVEAPQYEEIQLYTDENRTLDEKDIEAFFDGMGEEEEAVRRKGEFLVQQGLVYGRELDKRIHIVDTFEVPKDWTIYEIQDPGHAVAFATLYVALDPKGRHYVCDELYMRRKDIPEVVQAQRKLLHGDSPAFRGLRRIPQRSIIDPASKQVGAGMKGESVYDQIVRERKKQNHWCYEGRHKCYKANNEVRAGIFAVKSLMKVQDDGKPRLMIMRHCVHVLREIRRYRWPRPPPGKDLQERQGPIKKDDHLMDDLRYAALARLEHVPPANRPGWGANPGLKDKIEDFLRRRKAKKAKKQRESFSLMARK